MITPGWYLFRGTGRRHYFRSSLSLCDKYLLTWEPPTDGDDSHSLNCAECLSRVNQRKLETLSEVAEESPREVE